MWSKKYYRKGAVGIEKKNNKKKKIENPTHQPTVKISSEVHVDGKCAETRDTGELRFS